MPKPIVAFLLRSFFVVLFLLQAHATAFADVIPPPPIHPPTRVWGVVEKLTLQKKSNRAIAKVKILHVFKGKLPGGFFRKALGLFGRAPRINVRTYSYKTSADLPPCMVFEGVLHWPRNYRRRKQSAWQKTVWLNRKEVLIPSKRKPPKSAGQSVSCPSRPDAALSKGDWPKLKKMSLKQRLAEYRRASRIQGLVTKTTVLKQKVTKQRFFVHTRTSYLSTIYVERTWPRLTGLFPRRAKEINKGDTITIRWSRKTSVRTKLRLPGRYYGHSGGPRHKAQPTLALCQRFVATVNPYAKRTFWLHSTVKDVSMTMATPTVRKLLATCQTNKTKPKPR